MSRPEQVEIRPLEPDDAAAVATLHQSELPHGFFPQLGVGFLREYYRGFALSPHVIALVAKRDGVLAGVLVGMVDRREHFLWLLRQRGLQLALSALVSLLRRPSLVAPFVTGRLRRYGRWLLRARSQAPGDAGPDGVPSAAVLAHVAVAPHARNQGVGTRLVETFLQESAAAGRRSVRVTTLDGPGGAADFYHRTGWTPQASTTDWDGDPIVVLSRTTQPIDDARTSRNSRHWSPPP